MSTGLPRRAIGFNDSATEQIQRWLSDAKAIKAFNTIGAAHMFKPDFAEGAPTLFIAGNDETTKGYGNGDYPVVWARIG